MRPARAIISNSDPNVVVVGQRSCGSKCGCGGCSSGAAGQLGYNSVEVDLPPPPLQCLWGDPYVDASGVWTCPSQPVPPTTAAGPKPPLSGGITPLPMQTPNPGPPAWWTTWLQSLNQTPATGSTVGNGDGTIFGLPTRYVVIGGVALAIAAAVYLSSGGKSNARS